MTVPRITTRGYYDRRTGIRIKQKDYGTYPPNLFKNLTKLDEFVIVVHGMRNKSSGAASKVAIAADRLTRLNYTHKTIGFSYDSNVINGHLRNNLEALRVARTIATMNGFHLARFIQDIKKTNAGVKIRVMGHSLGSEVVIHAVQNLFGFEEADAIEAAYLFAASIGRQHMNRPSVRKAIKYTIRTKLNNYYYTNDEELQISHRNGHNPYPSGLYGIKSDTDAIQDIKVSPENHRFFSYAAVLPSFP